MEKKKNLTLVLVESALMVAFATVLSLIKLLEMPYGGSITLASMLPVLIIAYRHGVGAGLLAGLTYSAIQQLLGLNILSYFTTWQSIIAVILLDYIVAFTVVGLGGIFKGRIGLSSLSRDKRQSTELVVGMIFVCVLRYICHTIGGATVWAGLSIPTEAALIYSISYNATYMLPETIISALVAFWIGSMIDFSKKTPVRFLPQERTESSKGSVFAFMPAIAGLLAVVTVIVDTLLIAAKTQDPESGEYTFKYMAEVNWLAVGIVSAVGAVLVATLLILPKVMKKSQAPAS